jgi:hypothetical protein
MDDQEDHNHVRHDEGEESRNQTETTFGFPILDTTHNVNMKNISLSTLPTFYGKIVKTRIPSYLSLTSCVGDTTTYKMPRN